VINQTDVQQGIVWLNKKWNSFEKHEKPPNHQSVVQLPVIFLRDRNQL